MVKCKICGSEPKVEGGFSSVHDCIGYWCWCPKCQTRIGGKSVSTYEWGAYKPTPSREEIHQIHLDCEQSAIDKWNKVMTDGWDDKWD